MKKMKTVIVGGVAGGASTAARLRRLDENREIIILERGEYISFANCGLPYYIGGVITNNKLLTLQTPKSFKARFNIDVRIFSEVTEIDTANKRVKVRNVKDGSSYFESYDDLVLSPGAEPVYPNGVGADVCGVFTLRNIPDTYRIKEYIERERPARAVVVGGGYIGVEMAENLALMNIKVTIVEFASQVISPIDEDMACDVQNYLRENGVELLLNTAVKDIKCEGDTLKVAIDGGEISADIVIMSAGVRADTRFLSGSGIALSERGGVLADEYMRTNIENVYALGDAAAGKHFITGEAASIALAAPANKQGRIVADNICGLGSKYSGSMGTSIIKIFDMTVAATGINEKQAKASMLDYDKTYIYSASHASYYPSGSMMSIKAIWDRTSGKILGAQIVGFDGVDKRMDVIATAIKFGGKISDLKDLELCYAPPFSSAKDPVNMLGFVGENVMTGKVKQFYVEDVAALKRREDITLLDVRTAREVMSGKIEGFLHIPLDSLRENLDRLPEGRAVYVHCHSGLRSYIACRILEAKGFDCYNLAGGYRLYESVMRGRKAEEYVCYKCK